MLEIVEAAEPDAHRRAWNDLVLRQPVVTPFLRTWWLDARPAPTAARRFRLLVVDGLGELVGGLALAEDRLLGVPRYTFAQQGVLCPDHLDLIARPGSEDAVAGALATWVRRPGARLFDLDGLVEGSRIAALLGAESRATVVAPYQRLPLGSTYLDSRSASFRRSVRRGSAALERAGFAHRGVGVDELDRAWDDLRRLHEVRPGREALLAHLPTLRSAVDGGMACGEARVDVITDGATTAAVSVAFTVGGRLSLYQLARSLAPGHAGAGTVLLAAVVEDAAREGCDEVDLLRGDEDYKARFADHHRTVSALRVGIGSSGRLAAGTLTTAGRARGAAGTARRSVREALRGSTER